MKVTRTKLTSCPNCESILSAVTDEEGNIPKPGDFSICVYCNTPLTFTETMDLRLATEEEKRRIIVLMQPKGMWN